jgi:putative SOS response-associated peptidase YedK
MLVIIPASSYDYWLDPSIKDAAEIEGLLMPYPSEEMTGLPVSTRINSPKFDDSHCIEPLSEPPALFIGRRKRLHISSIVCVHGLVLP